MHSNRLSTSFNMQFKRSMQKCTVFDLNRGNEQICTTKGVKYFGFNFAYNFNTDGYLKKLSVEKLFVFSSSIDWSKFVRTFKRTFEHFDLHPCK